MGDRMRLRAPHTLTHVCRNMPFLFACLWSYELVQRFACGVFFHRACARAAYRRLPIPFLWVVADAPPFFVLLLLLLSSSSILIPLFLLLESCACACEFGGFAAVML